MVLTASGCSSAVRTLLRQQRTGMKEEKREGTKMETARCPGASMETGGEEGSQNQDPAEGPSLRGGSWGASQEITGGC